MKRILILFAAAALMFSAAQAEDLPGTSPDPNAQLVFAPEAPETAEDPEDLEDLEDPEAPEVPEVLETPETPEPILNSEGELQLDFDNLLPENPAATPVAVDPIDKPTPTPMPTPNFIPETYTNDAMGISFTIPYTWLLNPNTNQTTTVQFVEPKGEMMEPDGYQTRLTVEKYTTGLKQTAADARARLDDVLKEMAPNFTTFTPGEIASRSIHDAPGYYCYYKATYEDGTKTYNMRGRIIIVAYGNALYQVRITTPSNWYSYYQHAFRTVCSTFKFAE